MGVGCWGLVRLRGWVPAVDGPWDAERRKKQARGGERGTMTEGRDKQREGERQDGRKEEAGLVAETESGTESNGERAQGDREGEKRGEKHRGDGVGVQPERGREKDTHIRTHTQSTRMITDKRERGDDVEGQGLTGEAVSDCPLLRPAEIPGHSWPLGLREGLD